jgi:hypothetical protein
MNAPKQRHGCLTAWLLFVIAANSLVALFYVVAHETIARNLHRGSDWAVTVDTLLLAANVVFAIALFRWKRWGFLGLVATSLGAFVVNLSVGLSLGQTLVGLLGPLVLFGVLQIGGERKGWTQLE